METEKSLYWWLWRLKSFEKTAEGRISLSNIKSGYKQHVCRIYFITTAERRWFRKRRIFLHFERKRHLSDTRKCGRGFYKNKIKEWIFNKNREKWIFTNRLSWCIIKNTKRKRVFHGTHIYKNQQIPWPYGISSKWYPLMWWLSVVFLCFLVMNKL